MNKRYSSVFLASIAASQRSTLRIIAWLQRGARTEEIDRPTGPSSLEAAAKRIHFLFLPWIGCLLIWLCEWESLQQCPGFFTKMQQNHDLMEYNVSTFRYAPAPTLFPVRRRCQLDRPSPRLLVCHICNTIAKDHFSQLSRPFLLHCLSHSGLLDSNVVVWHTESICEIYRKRVVGQPAIGGARCGRCPCRSGWLR